MGEILNHLNWVIRKFEFHAVVQDNASPDPAYTWCKQKLGDRSGSLSECRWYCIHTGEGTWYFFRNRDDWLQFKLMWV